MTISALAVEDGIEAETGHTLTYSEGYPASCHNRGLQEHWYCAECDVYYDATGMLTNAKNLTIPAEVELEHVPAAEACHADGHTEYWYCPECDAVYADAAGTQLTNRKNLEIAPDAELVYVPAVAATATENGCAEYWYCPDCEAVYADAAGTQLTNRLNLTIPATGEEIPVTGDYSMVIFFAIAVIAMAGVVVLTKKNYNV